MLKSCKYCGRIHDSKYMCSKKPKNIRRMTEEDKFRNTTAWQNKREEVRQRDNYMCQVCIRKLYDTYDQYNYEDIEVHHAKKLNTNYDLRLDNKNLLTLCIKHHKMADKGEIPLAVILKIIKEEESKNETIY